MLLLGDYTNTPEATYVIVSITVYLGLNTLYSNYTAMEHGTVSENMIDAVRMADCHRIGVDERPDISYKSISLIPNILTSA